MGVVGERARKGLDGRGVVGEPGWLSGRWLVLAAGRLVPKCPARGDGDGVERSGERAPIRVLLVGVSDGGPKESMDVRSRDDIPAFAACVDRGGGLGFWGLCWSNAEPLVRMSRLGDSGTGPLISLVDIVNPFSLFDRSRVGDTSAETLDDDAAGIANGCE